MNDIVRYVRLKMEKPMWEKQTIRIADGLIGHRG